MSLLTAQANNQNIAKTPRNIATNRAPDYADMKFNRTTTPPQILQPSAKNLSGHFTAQINNNAETGQSAIRQESPEPRKPVFIAITGAFKGDGSDVTGRVAANSTTEKIFTTTQQLAKDRNTDLDGLYIAPGKTCDSSVKTAVDFVAKHHQPNEKLIVYGYSNGGRCAADVATALEKQKANIDLLVTVDATDRKSRFFGTNSTVDKTTPANVAIHHNFYQQDECGFFHCPQGEPHSPEKPDLTEVINHKTNRNELDNPDHKKYIHRYMEDINQDNILKVISNTLNEKANDN